MLVISAVLEQLEDVGRRASGEGTEEGCAEGFAS